MGDILVVGLAGRRPSDDWPALLGERAIVARHATSASAALPTGTTIDATYDAVFELVQLTQAAETIANAISEVADTRDVAYLTPGYGPLGDAVVACLASRRPLSIASSLVSGAYPSTPITVVDALELAAAESSEPFVGELPPLEPASALLVSNWHAEPVVRLAAKRLSRRCAPLEELRPDDDGFVFVPASDPLAANGSLAALEHIVARLRRDDGCPWDREQTPESLLPALAEESLELQQAIKARDVENIVEEMGDVLVNLLMQAQIATEAGHFRFADAIASAQRKLVRRHPHVFGDALAATPDEVLTIWRRIKAEEKAARDATAVPTWQAAESEPA